MSGNIVPIQTVKSLYAETAINQTQMYNVFKGSSETTYKVFTTSSFSTSNFNFSCPPPNQTTIISKKVVAYVTFNINFVGTTSLGNNLLDGWGLTMAPRALPLSRSTQNLVVRINDGSFSIPLNDIVTGISRYGYDRYKSELTESPCYLDQSQNYDELINTVRNPLGSSFNSSEIGTDQRGGFVGCTILVNTPTNATLQLSIAEPMLISPFDYSGPLGSGFIGVQSLDVTYTLDNNLIACLLSKAVSDPAVFTSTSISIQGQPSLLFTYFTPQELTSIPRSSMYSYITCERYPTDYQTPINPGQSVTIASNNIQINSIPKRMYVYARLRNQDFNINKTDTFLRIENISVSFGNRSGLLASANSRQLYEISKRNGCDLSFNSWYGSYGSGSNRIISGVGSVLALCPSIDIGLTDLQCVGQLNNLQLQMTATFTNINPTTPIVATMYIVVLSEGVATISDGRTTTQIGIISANEALNSPVVAIEQASGEGGSFMTGLRNIISQVPGVVKKVLPAIKTGYDVAKLLGLGEGEGMDGEMDGEGRRRRHKKKGKGLVGGMDDDDGGELVTRSQLRQNLY